MYFSASTRCCCALDSRWVSRVGERAQTVLQFVVDIFGDEHHFLDDFLLEAKFRKRSLQLPVGAFECRQSVAFGLAMGVPPRIVFGVHSLIHFPDLRDEFAESAQVRVAAVHLFLQNDAVESFARRFGQQFFRQRDVFLAGETEAVNDFADFGFGGLDAFGNLHFLLARQQRHLPHLLEIHPHRIIENVESRRVVFLGFRGFDAVHFRLIHDLNIKAAQLGENLVQFFRREFTFRQHVVDVVVGQTSLFLRKPDEFLDCFRQIFAAILQNAVGRHGFGDHRQ